VDSLLAAIIIADLGGVILSLAAAAGWQRGSGDPSTSSRGIRSCAVLHRLIGVSFCRPTDTAALWCSRFDRADRGADVRTGVKARGAGSRCSASASGVGSAKPAFILMAAWLLRIDQTPEMPATSMAMVLLLMLVSLLVMEPDSARYADLMVWVPCSYRGHHG
jgi:cell division protein FtsW